MEQEHPTLLMVHVHVYPYRTVDCTVFHEEHVAIKPTGAMQSSIKAAGCPRTRATVHTHTHVHTNLSRPDRGPLKAR